ncbi:TPA: hypothetical protein ACHIWN_005760 [Pseudomonas aeruginosa]
MLTNIFDFETTGIPEWKLPSEDPCQPHIVEVAALLCDAALPRNKLPTLAEAYKHFTGEDLVEAHRAMPDAEACARIYFALQGVDVAPPSSVPLAEAEA